MPEQCGPLFMTGAIDDLCFYKMEQKFLRIEDEVISSTIMIQPPADPRVKIISPLKRPWQRRPVPRHGKRYHRNRIFYRTITGFPAYDLKGPPGNIFE